MLDRYYEIALLGALEKYGSLTLAADSLNLSPPSASRMLARIEAELGFAVLDHGTRPAGLTTQARLIMPQVQKVLRAHEKLKDLVETVRGSEAEDAVLRLSLPVNSARDAIMVGVEEFKSRHENMQIEVLADLGENGLLNGLCDIAYFGYKPESECIFSEALEPEVNMLFASRRYVEEHGSLETVDELVGHTLLMRYTTNPSSSRELTDGSDRYVLHADQPTKKGDALYCCSEMMKGRGIALDLSFGSVEADLRRGDVVPILPAWHRKLWDNHLACHISNQNNPVIRELMTLIGESHDRLMPKIWRHWYRYFNVPEQPVLEEIRQLRPGSH